MGQAQGSSVDSQDTLMDWGLHKVLGGGVLTQSSFLRKLFFYCSVKASGIPAP